MNWIVLCCYIRWTTVYKWTLLYAIEFPHTHTHTHTHTHRLQYQQLLHTPTYITEESASETTDSISADITVQPHSFKVVIVSNRYVMDVPYTANVTPEYADGTKGSSYTFSGVYEGVQVNEICAGDVWGRCATDTQINSESGMYYNLTLYVLLIACLACKRTIM